MPMFYLDTSAIIKRYYLEQGSEVVDELLDQPLPGDGFHTSFLTLLEVASGMERLSSSGHLETAVIHSVLARIRRDMHDRFQLWPVSNEIIIQAISVVHEHKLRPADAIHLATALSVFLLTTASRVIMVSSDRRLVISTKAAGLPVLDPTDSGALAQLRQFRSHG